MSFDPSFLEHSYDHFKYTRFYINKENKLTREDDDMMIQDLDKRRGPGPRIKEDKLQKISTKLRDLFNNKSKKYDAGRLSERQIKCLVENLEDFNKIAEKWNQKVHTTWRKFFNLFGWYEVDKIVIPKELKNIEQKALVEEANQLLHECSTLGTPSDTIYKNILNLKSIIGEIEDKTEKDFLLPKLEKLQKDFSKALNAKFDRYAEAFTQQKDIVRDKFSNEAHWENFNQMQVLYDQLQHLGSPNSFREDLLSQAQRQLNIDIIQVRSAWKKLQKECANLELLEAYGRFNKFKKNAEMRLPSHNEFLLQIGDSVSDKKWVVTSTIVSPQEKEINEKYDQAFKKLYVLSRTNNPQTDEDKRAFTKQCQPFINDVEEAIQQCFKLADSLTPVDFEWGAKILSEAQKLAVAKKAAIEVQLKGMLIE